MGRITAGCGRSRPNMIRRTSSARTSIFALHLAKVLRHHESAARLINLRVQDGAGVGRDGHAKVGLRSLRRKVLRHPRYKIEALKVSATIRARPAGLCISGLCPISLERTRQYVS